MLKKAHPFFAVVLFGSKTLSFPPQVITAPYLLSHGISLLCIAGISTLYSVHRAFLSGREKERTQTIAKKVGVF
jgi:hypothetical protein